MKLVSRFRGLSKRKVGDGLNERLIDQRSKESIDVEVSSTQVSVMVYIMDLRAR